MIEKQSKGVILCDIGKLYDIQISSFINKVLLQHSHAHFFMFVFDCFRAMKAVE